jgi:hypothetical protein
MVKECGLLASPREYGVVPSGSVAAPRIKLTQRQWFLYLLIAVLIEPVSELVGPSCPLFGFTGTGVSAAMKLLSVGSGGFTGIWQEG